MKKVLLLAVATAALCGCQKAADNDEAPAASTSSAMAAAAPSPTATSMAGSYELTMKDGTKATSTLAADGTYMDMDAAGKQTEKGKWEQRPDGKVCFTQDGKTETTCYSVGPTQPDGTFVATPDKGDPLTV
jgi:hypothetical protein